VKDVTRPPIELYRWGDTPGVTQPVATTVTAGGGLFLFSNLWQGQYFIHLPALQFESNGNLRGLFSLPGFTTGDDDTGEDSLDTDTPWVTGVSSSMINLVREQAPTDTASRPATTTPPTSMTSTSTSPWISACSAPWRSATSSSPTTTPAALDAGEGLAGVRVELYTDTQFPGLDNPLAVHHQ
jgi:hypothetical protein